ncbi:MAG: pyridoxal phosphate-dependent aminotransferase [Acidimicrobiia bacterium]|nr:pyridoxal phosphate-dependent aminotransferase [Acidimicrobiia bacterium]
MSRISHRIGSIAESATMAVTAKAKTLRSQGVDVIGFGAGEPDFPTPDHIVEAAIAACRDPKMHKYGPVAGMPELREAVAQMTMRDSSYEVTASQVLITNGGKHAVFAALASIIDPGDEVLLPAPYWVTYPEAVGLAGGLPVVLPTDDSTGFQVTVDQLEQARTDRTKALIFVSPSNPTGAVYPPADVAAIGRWAAEHDVWVITDEIYDHLIYGDTAFSSIPALVPEIRDRCIVVNGVAKTYAMTGWRVGWMIGPNDVIKAAANLQSHSTSNVANVSQAAALAALTGPMEPAEEMRKAFDRRRRTMYRMLKAINGVSVIEPKGAFYAFPSFEALLGTSIRGHRPESTLELAELALEEAHVAIVPGEAFGAPGFARLSYALGDADLEEGVRRLAEFLAS